MKKGQVNGLGITKGKEYMLVRSQRYGTMYVPVKVIKKKSERR